jgi:hypothetical protein
MGVLVLRRMAVQQDKMTGLRKDTHGQFNQFPATTLTFLGCQPALRLLSWATRLRAVVIFTHDCFQVQCAVLCPCHGESLATVIWLDRCADIVLLRLPVLWLTTSMLEHPWTPDALKIVSTKAYRAWTNPRMQQSTKTVIHDALPEQGLSQIFRHTWVRSCQLQECQR